MLCQEVDRPVEPVEFKAVFPGLQPAPGEFSQAHQVETGILHQAGISGQRSSGHCSG